MTEPLVISFAGGPGCGKSTITAGVFSKLKWAGVNCEMATEFAKDKVWEESLKILEDQVYILGKQHHRLYRLKDQVEVVVTDSPIFLSMIYGEHWGDAFAALTLDLFNRYNNKVYVLERQKVYNPKGRVQGEQKARELDQKIREVLAFHGIPFEVIPGIEESVDYVVNRTLSSLDSVSVV